MGRKKKNKTEDMKKYQHEYYLKNIEKIRAYRKEYNLKHSKRKRPVLTDEEKQLKHQQQLEKWREQNRIYGKIHKKERSEYCKNKYNTDENFRAKRKAASKRWYEKNKERQQEKGRLWYQLHKKERIKNEN